MHENPGDRWSRQVRDWLDQAGQKTEDVARISKRQVELLQLEWDLLRRRADLGQRFLKLVDQGEFPGWSKDPHLADLVDSVRSLERRQRTKKDEIEDIRAGGPKPSGT